MTYLGLNDVIKLVVGQPVQEPAGPQVDPEGRVPLPHRDPQAVVWEGGGSPGLVMNLKYEIQLGNEIL